MTDPLAGNGERVMRAGSVSGKTFPVDPLAGMTREEARELVGRVKDYSLAWTPETIAQLEALAAIGAECVGAEEVVLNVSGESDWSLSPKLPNERLEPWERRVLVLKEDK